MKILTVLLLKLASLAFLAGWTWGFWAIHPGLGLTMGGLMGWVVVLIWTWLWVEAKKEAKNK